MGKLKQWIALTVVASLALLAAGWFLLISPKRATAAEVRTQTAATVAATDQMKTQLSVLKGQASKLPDEQAKLDAASAKIPADLGMPDLLRLLAAAATSSGVELVSVSPAALAPVAGAVAAPAAATAADTDEAAAPSAAPTAPAGAAGAGSLNSANVSMNVVGSYFRVQQFLVALEDLPRAVRVSNLTLAPGGAAGPGAADAGAQALTTTITGQVYVAVGRTPLAPVTLPGAPRSADAPKPTPAASPTG